MQRILITGAAGSIGGVLRGGLRGHYPIIRLTDIAVLGDAGPGEEIVTAELCDLAQMEAAMADVDAVVHLGGTSVESDWESIHANNIVGLYNTFEAARRRGVSRIVFASSNHAIGFYRRNRRIDDAVAPRPDTRYGVSKLFGEGLARLYADKHGIGAACLRIGSFQKRPLNSRMLSTWISHRDMVQLVRCCLDAPALHFEIVYGASGNSRSWWDNSAAIRLGYAPEDNAEDYADEILAAERLEPGKGEDAVESLFHGGPFTSLEFDGNTDKID